MEETLVGEVILSVLKVTVNKPALFTCLASNRHNAGANTVKATARVTVEGKRPSTGDRDGQQAGQLIHPASSMLVDGTRTQLKSQSTCLIVFG